jgi:NADPH:quinone reductase-like Zn-dependent oxidoreductase
MMMAMMMMMMMAMMAGAKIIDWRRKMGIESTVLIEGGTGKV